MTVTADAVGHVLDDSGVDVDDLLDVVRDPMRGVLVSLKLPVRTLDELAELELAGAVVL